MGERGKGSQVSDGKNKWVLRAQPLLGRVLVCVYPVVRLHADLAPSLMGCPAFPFIGQGKAWVTAEEKEEREREN